MSKRKPLLADVSRCHGDPEAPICQTCARRAQMAHDAADLWYSYLAKTAEVSLSLLYPSWECAYWIEEWEL